MLVFLSCEKDKDENLTIPEGKIEYEVTFKGLWSTVSHPKDYPSNSHFSPAVILAHKAGVNLFNVNTLATEGVKIMAETGATSVLKSELEKKVDKKEALAVFIGKGLSKGTSNASFSIFVDKDFPLVSIVSMIAPSPDWFIAVRDVNLFFNNKFVDELTVRAESYDAGTDSGSTFVSSNLVTTPTEKIIFLYDEPLGNGNAVEPHIAEFTFKKISQ